MKIAKVDGKNIYITKNDEELIKEICPFDIKSYNFNDKLKINNSSEELFVVEYSWSDYLYNLNEKGIDFIFELDSFNRLLENSNINSDTYNSLKGYLDDMNTYHMRGRQRRVKRLVERVLNYSNEINQLLPPIKTSEALEVLSTYKNTLTATEIYELSAYTKVNINEINTPKVISGLTLSFGTVGKGSEVKYNKLADLFILPKKEEVEKTSGEEKTEYNNISDSTRFNESLPLKAANSISEEEDSSTSSLSNIFELKEALRLLKRRDLESNKILNEYFGFLKDYLVPENLYTEDWNEVSREVKEKVDWTCFECSYKAENEFDKINIHTHHIDRNPQNNSPENLVVLCANCHSEQDGSGHKLISWKEKEVV